MLIDWSITLGNIITALGVTFGGIIFVYGLKGRLDLVEHDLYDMKEILRKMADNANKNYRMEAELESLVKAIDKISEDVEELKEDKRKN